MSQPSPALSAKDLAIPRNLKFKDGDMQLAEFARPAYRILVPENYTLEDILNPACWANVGETLKGKNNALFPIVELIWRDGTRYIEVIVIAAGRLWAKVHVLRDIDLSKSTEDVEELHQTQADSRFEVKWKGPTAKFAVTRLVDKEQLHSGFATKDEANMWLSDHIKSLK